MQLVIAIDVYFELEELTKRKGSFLKLKKKNVNKINLKWAFNFLFGSTKDPNLFWFNQKFKTHSLDFGSIQHLKAAASIWKSIGLF